MWSVAVIVLTFVGSSNGFWFWSSKRCYKRIGCFSNESPFNNAFGQIPQPPRKIKPHFLLYTRDNPDKEQYLDHRRRRTLKLSNFHPNRATKVIIHGYIHNGRVPWVKKMTRAILTKDNANVIVVDWERGALKFYYAMAVANTRVIGALTSELIKTLHRRTGAKYDTFHLIGHSLGAHVAGYAGERIRKLGRITGLDPAGPLFADTDPRVRLDPTDAEFVDVIHTDGNIFGFGIFSAIGTVDFYPNGGQYQPGCGIHSLKRAVNELTRLKTEGKNNPRLKVNLKKTAPTRDKYSGEPEDEEWTHVWFVVACTRTAECGKIEFKNEFSCDHMRAIDLFTSSVDKPCEGCACPQNTEIKIGTGCRERCSIMGYALSNSSIHGIYYLATTSDAPYCADPDSVRQKV